MSVVVFPGDGSNETVFPLMIEGSPVFTGLGLGVAVGSGSGVVSEGSDGL